MSCPYFKEGYFGICVAPDAIHVPTIAEMETYCFKVGYEICPNLVGIRPLKNFIYAERPLHRVDGSQK